MFHDSWSHDTTEAWRLDGSHGIGVDWQIMGSRYCLFYRPIPSMAHTLSLHYHPTHPAQPSSPPQLPPSVTLDGRLLDVFDIRLLGTPSGSDRRLGRLLGVLAALCPAGGEPPA